MSQELKPCAFCGSNDVTCEKSFLPPWFRVSCDSCTAEARGAETKEAAIAAWNTRAPQPDDGKEELLKALRSFIGAAFPVACEINPRGHNWCEAYLDQALSRALTAIARAKGGEGQP